MTVRRLAALLAAVTLVGSGAYVVVYLYRWEWNRAQISAAIFIAAEVGVLGWLIIDRMRRLERRLEHHLVQGEQRRLQLIRENAPPPTARFAWLARTDQLNVFIPVLLGAGVLLSGLAWVVERLARLTTGRVVERGLARRLGILEHPPGGYLDPRHDPLAVLRGPTT
jgi:hypothetical protein